MIVFRPSRRAMSTSSESGASGGQDPDNREKRRQIKTFIDEVVSLHNRYRELHGKVGDLRHNKELDKTAQKWADYLATKHIMTFSETKYNGQKVGENVATKWCKGGTDYTGREISRDWHIEYKNFDFENGETAIRTRQFTQMVWKDSEEIGVAKAQSADKTRAVVVCHYYPRGNIPGKFRENVFPKNDDEN